MKFRWSLATPQPLLAGQLARRLQISPLLAQCLLNRGLTEPDAIGGFLQPRLRNLADPFLLPNMDRAVDRLFRAREHKELVVIFGDYDVDGVTSTALLLEVLRKLGWTAEHYLPHRMDEGYGLSEDAVDNCLKKFPATLLLAVDCGSTSPISIRKLQDRGTDVIVVDHHQICSPPPPALALVNPQLTNPNQHPILGQASRLSSLPPTSGERPADRADSSFTELCSVGLSFKLAHALVKRGRQIGLAVAADFDLRPLLDLVSLGTIADIVPLTGENRILVSAGLERLNTTQRAGLVALKKVARCPSPIGTHEVGFQLGPRLNAAGRLETAEQSLQLLLARDLSEAMPLAQQLDSCNRERQQIERGIADQVISAVQARFNPDNDFVIVEGQSSWHIGVVGIVASRVLQQFYRPTIILGGDGAQWRGSGRSIAGFDLAGALGECSALLTRHGGHAMAAGLSLESANLETFRARLNELARANLTREILQAPLNLDAEVGLEEMTFHCLRALEQLKPQGQGNPAIQFVARNLTHQRPHQRLGPDKQHVKMWLSDGGMTQEAIWFGAGNELVPEGRFDLAFAPQFNDYNGFRQIQLRVLDWKSSIA